MAIISICIGENLLLGIGIGSVGVFCIGGTLLVTSYFNLVTVTF